MKKLLILSCLFLSLSTQADFNSALKIYDEKDYATAYDEFLAMAKVGEIRSQFNLGVMYYNGQHVEVDRHKAYAWMKLSVQGAATKTRERDILKQVTSKIKDLEQAEIEYQKLFSLYSSETLLDNLYPVLIEPKGESAFAAIPESIVEPIWPHKALRNGIQGRVRVQFYVDKYGVPRDIHIIESFPKKIFSRASIKAVKKWRFKTKTNRDGETIKSNQMNYTMEYRLYGSAPIQIKEKVYARTEHNAKQGDAIAQYNIGFWDKTLNNTDNDINPNEWFLKSAIQGHSAAQYELAKSLIYGKGCKIDKVKGLEWLTRSAASGLPKANILLGSLASKMADLESHKRAVGYLNSVEKLSVSAKLDYAWMLATSPYEEISNPTKAIDLSKTFDKKEYADNATLYELRAAAYAALGNYKKAISNQEEALEEAEDMKADLEDIKNHLASYKNNEKWF